MNEIRFPYGKEFLSYDFENEDLRGVLVSGLHRYVPAAAPAELWTPVCVEAWIVNSGK